MSPLMLRSPPHVSKHRADEHGARLELRLTQMEKARLESEAAARTDPYGRPLTVAAWVRDRLGLERAIRLWVHVGGMWQEAAEWFDDAGETRGFTVAGASTPETWKNGQRFTHAAAPPADPRQVKIYNAGGL